MGSKQEIEMNFRNALKQADKLTNAAYRLRKIADNDYRNELQNISNAWKGENASLFLQKCEVLTDRMDSTAEELKSIAETIKRRAKNIYDAEMRALDTANRRNY